MEHASGCPTYSFLGWAKFLDKNPWLSGTILVLVGAIMTLFGRKFFPWIMGVFSALVTFGACMILASIFGWLDETWSVWLCVIGAVLLALVAFYLAKTMTPISVGLLGIAVGFFGGVSLYSLLLAITGYEALWLFYTIVVLGALICGFLTFKHKDGFLSFCTAFLGGYIFMRGWTFYFGHYPSEVEMYQMIKAGQEIDLEWQFWVYYGVFVVTAVGGYVWQVSYYPHSDKKVDEYINHK